MRNLAEQWPHVEDWTKAADIGAGLHLATVEGLRQYLVSGNLTAFGASTGAFAGNSPVLRIARDRILAVNPDPALVTTGWNAAGFAMTDVSAMYHVFELSGADLDSLVSEAVLIDPQNGGPSAAIVFAGLPAIVYWIGEGRLRIHVERPYAAHLLSWMRLFGGDRT